ncbi:MAG: S8 family serine peptidase, partial [Anaerolineae bacterium]
MNLPRKLALVCLLILSVAAVLVWVDPAPRSTAAETIAESYPRPVVKSAPERTLLRLRGGVLDPLRDPVPASLNPSRIPSPVQPALRLIQFAGPVQGAWYQAMVDRELEVVSYIPDFAYLVWGTGEAVTRLGIDAPVRWHGVYHGNYALHPDLQALWLSSEAGETGRVNVAVQLYHHEGVKHSLAAIDGRVMRVLRPAFRIRDLTTLGVEVATADLVWLATLPDVVSVEPLVTPQLLDEVQGQIIAGHLTTDGTAPAGVGYLQWLTATVGLTTTPSAYPIVDVADDGVDDGDDVPTHPDFYEAGDIQRPDRLAYNANWTTDPTADGGGGHGTINAAIVGGYNGRSGFPYEDDEGYNYGLGINPFGRVGGSKIFGNTSGWAFPDYTELVGVAYALGARIISNSWGDDASSGRYLIEDQTYDALVRDADATIPGNQEVTIVFAAGNSGYSGSGTVGSPGNAKNVITVGASESYRPTWIDGCFVGPSGADSASDMASFSSRGPTDDGRVKPEIVAPGTHIQGAASQTPNYTGDFVCDAYHPSGQTLYAASSGTSHATPAVAGAASLLFRYYQDAFDAEPPSPAMAKAYLVNSARYLDGEGAADTLPSNRQGYGAVDLGMGFDDVPRVVEDQQVLLRETGESYVLKGHVARTDRPFRVTLSWTDAPGSTVGAAYVNDLDLEVTVGGLSYRGNVFSGPLSVSGGAFDPRNNVESVFLPAGVQGTFVITVTASNLAGDGVPGNADATDQDFALVCYNCALQSSFHLDVIPLTQEICQPSTAVYTVTTASIGGFSGSILLDARGYPAGTTATLVPNPIGADASSLLTIRDTDLAPPGHYTVSVRGVA